MRLVNRLGVTVDYLLADSVSDSNPTNIIEQFKQIMDGQPLERKQMAAEHFFLFRGGGTAL